METQVRVYDSPFYKEVLIPIIITVNLNVIVLFGLLVAMVPGPRYFRGPQQPLLHDGRWPFQTHVNLR